MRIIILTLFIFISCKNEDVVSAKKIIVKENNKLNETNKEIIDTVFFDFEKNNIDFAVINLLLVFIEIFFLLLKWSQFEFGNIIEISTVIRIINYSSLASVALNLDFEIEGKKV